MASLRRYSKNIIYTFMIVITVILSVVYYFNGFSLESRASGYIGENAAIINVRSYTTSGGSQDFSAEEYPSLMVSLGPPEGTGYNIPVENGLIQVVDYYKDYTPTVYHSDSVITLMNDKTARFVSAGDYQSMELVWYTPGEEVLRTSGNRSTDWYNSVLCKYNGAPSSDTDPTGGAGVYRAQLAQLANNKDLGNWKSLVNDQTRATSKALWGYFGNIQGNSNNYSFDIKNRIMNYCGVSALDYNAITSWTEEQSTNASIAHLDLLMTLYSAVDTTVPQAAESYENAINRYIENGTQPGEITQTCNIVIFPAILFRIKSENRTMITGAYDVWNYAYGTRTEHYLAEASFKDILAINNLTNISDLYTRLHNNVLEQYKKVVNSGGKLPSSLTSLYGGGFSYSVNYAFGEKTRAKGAFPWEKETNGSSRRIVESLYLTPDKGATRYNGLNVIVAPPTQLQSSSAKLEADFKVIWQEANAQYTEVGMDQNNISDIVHFMINLKIAEEDKATWQAIFDKYDKFKLKFTLESNDNTGRVAVQTTDGATATTIGVPEYQLGGVTYSSDQEVDVTEDELYRYLMGDTTYTKLYDIQPKNQVITPGEVQEFGYNLKVTVIYGDETTGGSKSSSWTGYGYDNTDGERFYHRVMAMRTDSQTIKYYSSPEVFSEFKEGTVERNGNGSKETYEAMAGVPTTETMYFTSGGSEFIVELELQFISGERSHREYRTTFFGTECEFKRNDQWKSSGTGRGTVTEFSPKSYTNEQYNTFTDDFVADINGVDTSRKDVVDQWFVLIKPEGAASYTNQYYGHDASLPVPHDKDKNNYTGSTAADSNDCSSTTFTATWTGEIKNNASDPGVVNDRKDSGVPCSGDPGDPGNINPSETTNWDTTKYAEAIQQAYEWAAAYEKTNNNKFGTASKLSDSDNLDKATETDPNGDVIRTWKIGNATIAVSITGGSSNVRGRSYYGGSYTTGNYQTAISDVNNTSLGRGYNEIYGSQAHGSCSESGEPPKHTHGSWSGYKKTETKTVGDLNYTIKVTFDNGTLDAHELCGPCCSHDLPQIFDTWRQNLTYDYTRINTMRVYKIHRGYVDGMEEVTLVDYKDSEDAERDDFLLDWMHGASDEVAEEITAAEQSDRHNGTDTIVAAISQGDPNIFYNIAEEQPYYKKTAGSGSKEAVGISMAGRVRYSFQPQQHDWVYIEEMTRRGNVGWADGYSCATGSRSNKCDGLGQTVGNSNPIPAGGGGHAEVWANGILYSTIYEAENQDEYWMATDFNDDNEFTEDEWGTAEKKGKGRVKTEYSGDYLDDKDVLTEEYHRFVRRRNLKNTVHIISDMLLLQTSTGDQPVMHYSHGHQTKRLQQHYDYNEADVKAHQTTPSGHSIPLEGYLLQTSFENSWYDNPHCAYNWGDNNIGQYGDVNVGSYTGEYQLPHNKFSSTINNVRFGTYFDRTGGVYEDDDYDSTCAHPLMWVDKYYGPIEGGGDSLFRDTKDYGANKYDYMSTVQDYGEATYVGRQTAGFGEYGSSVVPGAVETEVVANVIDKTDPRQYKTSPCFKTEVEDPGLNAYDDFSSQARMNRVNGLRIFTDEILQDPTNPNKEYIIGDAYQTYIMIMDYDRGAGTFPHKYNKEPVYATDLDNALMVDGFILDAPYSREHEKINDFVVHNPVSTENATLVHSDPSHDNYDDDNYTWEDDFSKDSRTGNELMGASNLKAELNKLQKCPENAELCDFRILDCSFDQDEVVANFDFETEYKDANGNTKVGSHDNKIVNTIDGTEYTLPTGFEVLEIKKNKFGANWPFRLNDEYIVPDNFGEVVDAKMEKVGIDADGTGGVDTFFVYNKNGDRWTPNDTEYVEWYSSGEYDRITGEPENSYSYRNMFGGVYGKYLKCYGTRLSFPLADWIGSYQPSTRIAVEMNIYKPIYREINLNSHPQSWVDDVWPHPATMVVSFNNYAFYLPEESILNSTTGYEQNRTGAWTTGNGIDREVKNTNFIDQTMKLKLVFDFSDASKSEVYINGQKTTQYTLVQDPKEITSADIGKYLNIGSWSKNDNYPAAFYIDNLKVTNLATDLEHDASCYETIINHATTLQYSCQTTDTYNYVNEVGGEPSLHYVQTSGKYKLEAYGAQGGGTANAASASHGGMGGYSYGYTHLNKGQQLMVYPGGQGSVSHGTGEEYAWTLTSGCGEYSKLEAIANDNLSGITYVNSVDGTKSANQTLAVCWSTTKPSGFTCGNHSLSVALNADGSMITRVKGHADTSSAGWNGGGYGQSDGTNSGYGGGGASDIRVLNYGGIFEIGYGTTDGQMYEGGKLTYGPYIAAGAGHYQADIYGEGLDQCTFDAYSNVNATYLDITETRVAPNHATIYFTVPSELPASKTGGLEVRVHHDGVTGYKFEKVYISRLEDRIIVAGGGGGADNAGGIAKGNDDGSGGAGGGSIGGNGLVNGLPTVPGQALTTDLQTTVDGIKNSAGAWEAIRGLSSSGCGLGGGQNYGYSLGVGESASYTADTGGAGGGYYGGYVTNHANGGAGGGSGYVGGLNSGDTLAGANGGNGICTIQFIEHETSNATGTGVVAKGLQLMKTFNYTGNVQKWVVPASGTYLFKTWGASGGDARIVNTDTIVENSGGAGGYATGTKYLTAGQTLYIYVGGEGQDAGTAAYTKAAGGYNGGGDGGTELSGESYPENGAGGGGASDIRTSKDDLNSRLIVAGGGGGAGSHFNPSTGTADDPYGISGLQYKTVDGVKYARVLYQDLTDGNSFFTTSNMGSVNTPTLFSCLNKLEEFRTSDGYFQFLLEYPDATGVFEGAVNIWRQTSNPFTEQKTNGSTSEADATGFKAIKMDMPGYKGKGLEYNGNGAILDGTVNHGNWWLAVGAMTNYSDSEDRPYAMPGPHDGTNAERVAKVALWVRADGNVAEVEQPAERYGGAGGGQTGRSTNQYTTGGGQTANTEAYTGVGEFTSTVDNLIGSTSKSATTVTTTGSWVMANPGDWTHFHSGYNKLPKNALNKIWTVTVNGSGLTGMNLRLNAKSDNTTWYDTDEMQKSITKKIITDTKVIYTIKSNVSDPYLAFCFKYASGTVTIDNVVFETEVTNGAAFNNFGAGQDGYSHNAGNNYGSTGGGGGGYFGGTTTGTKSSVAFGGAGGSSYIKGLGSPLTVDGNYEMPSPTGANEVGHRGNGVVQIYLTDTSEDGTHTVECQFISSINNYHVHKKSCISQDNIVLRQALNAEYNGNGKLLQQLLGSTVYDQLKTCGVFYSFKGFNETDYRSFNFSDMTPSFNGDGALYISGFGADPRMTTNDLNIEASSVTEIRVNAEVADGNPTINTGYLLFTTSTSTSWDSSTKILSATYDSVKKQYVFDTTENSYWDGIITSIAIHPVANNSTPGIVKISSIDLYGSGTMTTDIPVPQVLNTVSNFQSGKGGGFGITRTNSGASIDYVNGNMIVGPSFNGYEFSVPINIDNTDNLKFIRITLKNKTPGTQFHVCTYRDSAQKYATVKSMEANQTDASDWQTVIIPIDSRTWDGALDNIRFSVANDSTTTGTVVIKGIEFIGHGTPAQGVSTADTASANITQKNWIQGWSAPYTGEYTIKLWGANGGGSDKATYTGSLGGLGGYAEGKINLNKGDGLLFLIGGKGSLSTGLGTGGGYNGGGHAGNNGFGGGGLTSVYRNSGIHSGVDGHNLVNGDTANYTLSTNGTMKIATITSTNNYNLYKGGNTSRTAGQIVKVEFHGSNLDDPAIVYDCGIYCTDSACTSGFHVNRGATLLHKNIQDNYAEFYWLITETSRTHEFRLETKGAQITVHWKNVTDITNPLLVAGGGGGADNAGSTLGGGDDGAGGAGGGTKGGDASIDGISTSSIGGSSGAAPGTYVSGSYSEATPFCWYNNATGCGNYGKYAYSSSSRAATTTWCHYSDYVRAPEHDYPVRATGGTQSSGYQRFIGESATRNTDTGGAGAGYWGGLTTNNNNGGAGGGSGYVSNNVTSGKTTTSGGTSDGAGYATVSYNNYTFTPATIITGADKLGTVFSPMLDLDGSEQSILDAIAKIQDYVDSIPDEVGGEYNPIFDCGRLYNEHDCALTNGGCVELELLNCTEPHHYGMHYTSISEAHEHGKDFCYKACMNDKNHAIMKDEITEIENKSPVYQEEYINTDEYFDIYFPNNGDFYESDLHAIGSTTQTRGMGYEDDTDTSEWTREKYVRFTFDTLFYREETEKWEQYSAGSWIELPVKGHSYPYYHFYCTLNNSEMSAAIVEFEVEAINAPKSDSKYNYKNFMNGTEFGKVEFENIDGTNHGAEDFIFENHDVFGNDGDTASNHKNNNDNKNDATNRERFPSLKAWHGGHKEYYVDVVGRIGNLFITDTDDLRFSNLFKLPKSGGDWLIDGIVREVYENIQNYYLSWNYMPYEGGGLARDVRNRLVDRDHGLYNVWLSQSWNGASNNPTSAMEGHALEIPLGSSSSNANNPAQLLGDLLKPGYNINFEVTTTGNYTDLLQVKPYYYALCVEDDPSIGHTKGSLYPIDVHMSTDNNYETVNFFGAVDNTDTWEGDGETEGFKDKVFDYDLSLNWNEEYWRRNYTEEEKIITETLRNKMFTYDEDSGTDVPLVIPSGDYYHLGNAQILRAEGNARTFIGTNRTAYEGDTFNGGNDTNFDGLFDNLMYNYRAQRWHLKLGLPSSAVFTFYENGKHIDPLDQVKYDGVDVKAYEIIKNSDKYVIVMTANIKSLGSVWNLAYMQNVSKDGNIAESAGDWSNGSVVIDGQRYDFNYLGKFDEDGMPVDSEFRVVLAVYDPSNTSEVDVDIIGTH